MDADNPVPHRIEGSTETITGSELIPIVDEHSELIEFIQAIETGLITVTLTEYHMLPGTFLTYWRIYRHQVQEIREHQRQNPKQAGGVD